MKNIILFCQQNKNNGNIWDALGPIIIFAVIIFLRFFSEAMKSKAQKQKMQAAEPEPEEEDAAELLLQMVKESRKKSKNEKRRKRRPPQKSADEDYELTLEDSRPARTVLARELAPQGTGSRFEAEPGTLDASSIVAPSVESNVKSTLDSLTGIYDEQPSTEVTSAAAFAGFYTMLAQPEGIRNAVVLSEIFSPGGKWKKGENL